MIELLYIDLFAGAGGTSTGVEHAQVNGKKCAKVIACVNHDANAIASHAANHPDALHFTEDIRTLDLTELVEHSGRMRRLYPDAELVIWASLECTNFSKAKGGQPRDADSRTLAEHLYRYIEALNPEYIQIENVEEFMSWGPLNESGKPVSKSCGIDYMRWLKHIQAFGYQFDFRILNSADFGAYTSRKRYFAQFAKYGLPISWPEPTHTKNPTTGTMFSNEVLSKYRAVRDVLDLHDEGESIFKPGKIKSEKTRERIYAGLIKFVAGGKDAFLVKWNSMSRNGTYAAPDIDSPSPVVSTQNRLGVARVTFLSKYYSGKPEHKNISVDQPAGTITTIDSHALVSTEFLSAYYGNGDNVSPVDGPAPTVTTKDRLSLVQAKFLNSYNYKDEPKDIEATCPTLTTKDRFGLVSPQFLDQQYGQSKPASINSPCNTLTGNPKYNLVSCAPFIMNNYSGGGQHSDIEKPSYLVVSEGGQAAIEVYETDTVMERKIKEFMALYGIIDIKMRMLKIPELLKIMGFPANYKLIGTQAEQKKQIGNAVEVNTANAMCSALAAKLYELKMKVA